jgi:lysophospholipase L1-like esterase
MMNAHRPLFLLALGVAGLGSGTACGADCPKAPGILGAPASTIPSDSNHRLHPDWNQACEDRLAAMQGKRCDVLFIGDSITDMWNGPGEAVWEHFYAGRHALNFGVGGDKTQNVIWRLETWAVRGFKPKIAVILIGTNNVGDPVEEIAAGVKAVLTKTEQLFPGTRVILVSILPRADHREKVTRADQLIRAFADEQTVFFFDLAAKMTSQGDTWKGLGPDRLHLGPEGYALWATEMEPWLARLLAETPLSPGPGS